MGNCLQRRYVDYEWSTEEEVVQIVSRPGHETLDKEERDNNIHSGSGSSTIDRNNIIG